MGEDGCFTRPRRLELLLSCCPKSFTRTQSPGVPGFFREEKESSKVLLVRDLSSVVKVLIIGRQ
jgi:hypothetical protein